jgi:type VI secretion system protein ImpB
MAIQDEIPRSRITLTYRTTINGEPETVSLPLRLLLLGDFSQGTSKDQKLDLDDRDLRNLNGANLDAVIADMGITSKFTVANKISPADTDTLDITLPITGLKSFTPDQIAQQVPQVRALLLLKTLLLEIQANIDNRKDLRKKVAELFSKPDAVAATLADLKGYESFVVPAAPALPGTPTTPVLTA